MTPRKVNYWDVSAYPDPDSENADRGVEHALAMADTHDAHLDVLLLSPRRPRVDVRLRGVPHQTILESIETNDIGVVVMGKRGATGLETPHIGSYWWLYVRNDIRHHVVANYFSLSQPPVAVTDRVVGAATVPVIPV